MFGEWVKVDSRCLADVDAAGLVSWLPRDPPQQWF